MFKKKKKGTSFHPLFSKFPLVYIVFPAKLDFFPTNKWIYKYLSRRRRNFFTVMVLLQKKRAVLARPTQKSATQRAAKNTHKSPFRPSLQRIERWHIVQPLNFENHTGQGKCWPAFTRALRRACTLCMHVCTAMLRVTHLLAAHLGSSQTISAAETKHACGCAL